MKIEDVINRGGGLLGVELFNSKEDGTPDHSSNVILSKDGEKLNFLLRAFYLKPGERSRLFQECIINFGDQVKKFW